MQIKKIKEILRVYKTLRALHGIKNVVYDTAIKCDCSIAEVQFALDYAKAENIHEVIKDKEYGLVIGRFQPFHYGHQHIINEVLLSGKTPIILLGCGGDETKNPLTYSQRKELIKLIYPDTEIIFKCVYDRENWTEWFDDVGHLIVGTSGRHVDQVTLYYNNKPQDRYDHFECQGREYYNEFYTKIFEDNGLKTQQVEFVERTDITVNADATNIRDNFEDFKHLLDARVYHKLKEWGW